jgi:hypothetical protein
MSDITLFVQQNPGVLKRQDLYDPTTVPPSGTIIPAVDSLVVDEQQNYTVFIVKSVDPVTHASTLVPAQLATANTNPADSLTSIISYGNDIFRLFYDLRTTPITVQPDDHLIIFGTGNVSYQLVLNPGANQQIISRYYDASGTYVGQLVPLGPVISPDGSPSPAASYLTPCHVQVPLTDGQEVFIQVFNSDGAQTATVSAFAKPSIIVNEAITPSPVITAINILSPQSRSNNEVFIYERQTISSLGLQVQLTYSDGNTRIVVIDNSQCFLYGTEDFVPSFPGLRQTLVAKYFLDQTEAMTSVLAAQNPTFVTAEVDLVVIANGLQAGVKLTTIPRWNAGTNKYDLSFFLYSVTRDRAINVTSLVTIDPGTPYDGGLFGSMQALTVRLDMSLAEPTLYSTTTIYQQTCVITLSPLDATDRYVLRDATNSPLVYGQTTTAIPRPVIHWSSPLQQYYVPVRFATTSIFLQAFYWNANPPYDTTTETQAPTPTHFWLRDPSSGVLLNSAPIPLASYQAAFSIVGAGLANRYAAGSIGNVIVEFIQQLSPGQNLLLFGVPADVYLNNYNA